MGRSFRKDSWGASQNGLPHVVGQASCLSLLPLSVSFCEGLLYSDPRAGTALVAAQCGKDPRPMPTARPARSRAARDTFARVDALARNLWWTWKPEARLVLESMDPALFRACDHNPIATLARLDDARRATLATDPEFLERLSAAERGLADYLGTPTWFERTAKGRQKDLLVAYFCMEYGLHESLPLYAGGLGILAADHLKSASDLGVPLVAVGILWRKGYYRQELRGDGTTRVVYPHSDFGLLPVVDTGVRITVPIGASGVRARLWRLAVGRVPLVLLDTDLAENTPEDRELTWHLYGGESKEYRLRQEILLGVGGLIALDALEIEPTVCHLNEGHAAFCPLERVRRLVAGGESIRRAVRAVRGSSVFTTHTPVPEGNDRFDPALVMKYLSGAARSMGLSEQQFLSLGREDERDATESYCMTVLALKLSDHCNGVAELHGDTSRRMWMKTYGVTSPDEVPIGHVTNGVHPESWIAEEARPFYDRHLKPRWNGAGPEDDWWKGVSRVPAGALWETRRMLRRAMIARLRLQLREQIVAAQGDVSDLVALYETLDEDALTIGFARRFATYKRAPLIFRDMKRLVRLMSDRERPVQLIFAGKAHPLDKGGQEFVRIVHEHTRHPALRGRVHLVTNYSTAIGRMLTSGCDVWLNNPVRPMEASGTSGMKPPLNLGVNCSILDGWWPEGYNGKNGWALGGKQFKDRAEQDAFDAEAIYTTLERKVVPLFYTRDRRGVPAGWVKMMAESMRTVCREFSTHRMVADYTRGYYLPAHAGGRA
ncbi:MAG TPA: alpha-glucan phosphorylase [Phycisphaerales bacterium]|nr:alpha-glucan phosphorylase [Phycisphaerales bacterium]